MKPSDHNNHQNILPENLQKTIIKAAISQYFKLKTLEDPTYEEPHFASTIMQEMANIHNDENRIQSLVKEFNLTVEIIMTIIKEIQEFQVSTLGENY